MKKSSMLLITLIAAIVVILVSCEKVEIGQAPELTTLAANEITQHTAVLFGVVDSENNSAVTSRGFCWNSNPNLGLNDSLVYSGFGPGVYSAELYGLNTGKVYYYKAFATNSNGTAFGQELSFTTSSEPIVSFPLLSLKNGFGYTFSDVTVLIGSTIKFGVVAEKSSVSNNKLTRFKVDFTENNIPQKVFDTILYADSFNWEGTIRFDGVGAGVLSFQLTDIGAITTTESFKVIIEDSGSQINKFMDVSFGSWDDANGSFFSTTEGLLYTIGQTKGTPANQARIDFAFFKGASNGNSLASPDNAILQTITALQVAGWTTKNQTRFNETNISVSQFDAIGETYSFPNFNLSGTKDIINNLIDTGENGRVYLFKTVKGKLGLIKIDDLYSRGDRAKVDIIVQK